MLRLRRESPIDTNFTERLEANMTNNVSFVTFVTDTLVEVVDINRAELLIFFGFDTRHYIRTRQ